MSICIPTRRQSQSRPSAERFFDGAANARPAPARIPVDVYETEEAVVVRASLPGCDKDAIEISFREGRLSIRASRAPFTAPENGRVRLQERQGGDLSRTLDIHMALDADRATASYEAGVLTLSLPKAQQARKHRIPIQ